MRTLNNDIVILITKSYYSYLEYGLTCKQEKFILIKKKSVKIEAGLGTMEYSFHKGN